MMTMMIMMMMMMMMMIIIIITRKFMLILSNTKPFKHAEVTEAPKEGAAGLKNP
jgi:hypothetical protein